MKSYTNATAAILGLHFCVLSASSVCAQSTQPDGTSQTMLGNCLGDCITIDGGIRRGQNLFHSFAKFSIESGSTVRFLDPGVNNILGRVTGTESSEIAGTLSVRGVTDVTSSANLFLINPNGIIFGPNSQLDVPGSFVGSTAEAVQFGDQGFFSTDESNIPVLTINPTALFINNTSGEIKNQSTRPVGLDPSGLEVSGLKVPDGESFLLVGGDIVNDGGGINAFGGQVELVGVSESGTVSLSNSSGKFGLSFPDNLARSNISFLNGAKLNVTAAGNGSINIYGHDITISGESEIRAGIAGGVDARDQQAGDIIIDAANNLSIVNSNVLNRVRGPLEGEGAEIGLGNAGNIYVTAQNLSLKGELPAEPETRTRIETATYGVGNAGDIIISVTQNISLDSNSRLFSGVVAEGEGGGIFVTSKNLNLTSDSFVITNSFGQGNAGDISIAVSEAIRLDRRSNIISNNESPPEEFLLPVAVGNAGTIDIETKNLTLNGGSQIGSSILPRGIGLGGDVNIYASESVTISGFNNLNGNPSGLISETEPGAVGEAGNIVVRAGTVSISEGGIVSALTENNSEGGSLAINAEALELIDGGQIVTSTFQGGDAGNINIDVNDRIILSGEDPNFEERLELTSNSDFLIELGSNSGIFAATGPDASGNAGSISIDPQLVLIQDGARIAVSNEGTGLGGNIDLIAENLILDNQASISAATASAQGGDIDLTIADLLFLNNNSEISATAGIEGGNGIGGNITIEASVIAASPQGNNDIIANASDGSGGTILIDAQGIFGFQAPTRDELLELSPDLDPERLLSNDITAISQNSSDPNLSGQVILNTPETDPSDSTTELTENIDIPPKLAQSCRPGQALGNGQFANVGKGGLPSTPTSLRSYPAVWHDIRPPSAPPQASTGLNSQLIAPKTKTPPIIEAKGWVTTDQGLMLVAPENLPSSLIASGAC